MRLNNPMDRLGRTGRKTREDGADQRGETRARTRTPAPLPSVWSRSMTWTGLTRRRRWALRARRHGRARYVLCACWRVVEAETGEGRRGAGGSGRGRPDDHAADTRADGRLWVLLSDVMDGGLGRWEECADAGEAEAAGPGSEARGGRTVGRTGALAVAGGGAEGKRGRCWRGGRGRSQRLARAGQLESRQRTWGGRTRLVALSSERRG